MATAGWQNTPTKREKTPQIHFYPRLQQFIQLYWYFYITGTLDSGEIIGRITHITCCGAKRGHKYWCGRPEGGGEGTDTHTHRHRHTLLYACHHLPVRTPTCTAWSSSDSQVR